MLDHRATRTVCHFLVGSAWLLLARITRAESPAEEHVKVELVSDQQAIVPHQQLRVGIRFDLQEGWHTYWINPGDSGEAPRIEWTLPAGFEASSIQWPCPTRLSTPPFVDYGYEHQVLLPVLIRTPSRLEEGATEEIIAHVHYLICREVCIPGQKQLVLELPVKNHARPGLDFALFAATWRQLPKPIPEGWRISAISIGDEFQLRLKIGHLAVSPQLFPLEPEEIENSAGQNVTMIAGGLNLHLKKSNHLLKPISRIKGVLMVAGTAYLVDIPVLESSGQRPAQ
jgi:DsbC/DsbD-like thiol-disulfide interchange protein